jgi:hypothetical protein
MLNVILLNVVALNVVAQTLKMMAAKKGKNE